MELPITREQLQNYRNYYADFARKKQLETIANQVYKGIQQIAIQNRETRFSYTVGHNLQYCSHTNGSSSASYRYLTVEEVMEFLKEKFIGCNIITDPLKSYILIDWS